MNDKDFVLEFVVHFIMCKNLQANASPLLIQIRDCTPLELNPTEVTLTKLTYEKGKRLYFQHSKLLDLYAKFYLQMGHGNTTIRSQCSFDFFELAKRISEIHPTVYELDAAMVRMDQSKFGVMKISFQIFPLKEYLSILNSPRPSTASHPKIVKPVGSSSSSRSNSVKVPKNRKKRAMPVELAEDPI